MMRSLLIVLTACAMCGCTPSGVLRSEVESAKPAIVDLSKEMIAEIRPELVDASQAAGQSFGDNFGNSFGESFAKQFGPEFGRTFSANLAAVLGERFDALAESTASQIDIGLNDVVVSVGSRADASFESWLDKFFEKMEAFFEVRRDAEQAEQVRAAMVEVDTVLEQVQSGVQSSDQELKELGDRISDEVTSVRNEMIGWLGGIALLVTTVITVLRFVRPPGGEAREALSAQVAKELREQIAELRRTQDASGSRVDHERVEPKPVATEAGATATA